MTKESTLQPFQPGDIFAGATVLNNPDDDHAGDGRIIQYDRELNEKGVLWLDGPSHLTGGLKFGPDKTLWAFDSQEFKVMRIGADGTLLPAIDFPQRSFSNINFAPDGTLILGEHLVGAEVKLPPDRPLGTKLPFIPDGDRFGDGHVFRCSMDGKVIAEYATESHGGMPGFLGVTSATLAPDGRTLIYCSELGTRLFRFDIETGKQLPDLITYEAGSGNMTMIPCFQPDGTLLYIMANFREGFFLQKLDPESGEALQTWNTEGPGWASMGVCTEPGNALIGNFFTGALIKMNLASGDVLARADTGVQRSLAGIAQFPD